jgi:hypothetical protein
VQVSSPTAQPGQSRGIKISEEATSKKFVEITWKHGNLQDIFQEFFPIFIKSMVQIKTYLSKLQGKSRVYNREGTN